MVATQRPIHKRASRYVATNQATRSVATQRPTKPFGRSLRSDRPNLSLGRYVATNPVRIRSLRSDRTVSDIDQRVLPKSIHSRLFLNASYHIISHLIPIKVTVESFTIKSARTCFCRKESRNKRFMSKDGPTRSKTRLQAHLRFFKNELVDTMAVYVFIL